MSADRHCPIPWRSLYVAPDGRVAPCCAYYDGVYDGAENKRLMDHPHLEKVRQTFQAGDVPKGCSNCFEREAMGITSWRTEATAHYEKYWSISTKGSEVSLRHLDISFGNVCNLKCRFCRPENSSAWIADARELNKIREPFWRFRDEVKTHSNARLIDHLLEQDLSELRYLEIKGGEPFIYKAHGGFLEKLSQVTDVSRVMINYSTNGTAFQPEVMPYLKNFKSVGITFSIDGTGSAYQYIRGGDFRLEKEIEENVRLFDQHGSKNMQFSFYFTVCAYNVFEMNRLADWVKALELKRVHRIVFVPLTDPKPIQVGVLPASVRREVASSLKEDAHFDDIKRVLMIDDPDQPFLFEDFMKYTKDLDQVRGEDVKRSIPELAALF